MISNLLNLQNKISLIRRLLMLFRTKILRSVSYAVLLSGMMMHGKAHAQALPEDASSLTDGTFIVEATPDVPVDPHEGDIGISGNANLTIQSTTTDTNFQVNGNITVGGEENPGGSIQVKSETENTSLNTALTLNGGTVSVLNGGRFSVVSTSNNTAAVSGMIGVNIENGELSLVNSVMKGDDLTFAMSGGVLNLTNSSVLSKVTTSVSSGEEGGETGEEGSDSGDGTVTYDDGNPDSGSTDDGTGSDGGDVGNPDEGGEEQPEEPSGPEFSLSGNVSMDNSQFGMYSDDISIVGPDITVQDANVQMQNQSQIKKINSGDIEITQSQIDMANSAVLHGGQTGDISITDSTLTLNGNSQIVRGIFTADSDGNVSQSGGNFPTKTATEEQTGNIDISGSTITLNDSSKIHQSMYDSDINLDNSTLSLNGNSSVQIDQGSLSISGSTVNLAGNASLTAYLANSPVENAIYLYSGEINASGASKIKAHTTDFRDGTVLLSGTASLEAEEGHKISGAAVSASENSLIKGDVTLGSGSLTLADSASLSGSAEVNGGELLMQDSSSLTGNASITGGTVSMDGSSEIGGNVNLTGTGGLAMAGASSVGGNLTVDGRGGSSTVSVKGDNSIDGLVSIKNAILDMGEGSRLTTGNFTAGEGSQINISTGEISLKPGSTMSFEDGSIYNLTINGLGMGEYGKVTGATAVNIADGSRLNVIIKRGIIAYNPVNMDLFSGTVTGNFLNSNMRYEFSNNGNGTFEVVKLDNVEEIVDRFGGNASEAAAADAWLTEGVTFGNNTAAQNLVDELDLLSQNNGTGLVNAISALAPDSAPKVQIVTRENNQQIFRAVTNRLHGGSSLASEPERRSLYQYGRYERGRPSTGYYRDSAFWAQGMYNYSDLSDTDDFRGFTMQTWGGAVGIDNYFTDDLKLGIGYSYLDSDGDSDYRHTDVATHTGFVYAEYKPNNWYMNMIATYGMSSYKEDKDVLGEKIKAEYDVDSIGAQVMTGYKMGGITPEVGMRYVTMKMDEYTDSIGQNVKPEDVTVLTGVLGVTIKQDFKPVGGFTIRPEAHIAATYDISRDDGKSVVSLGNGTSYEMVGEDLDKFGVEAGVALTMDVQNWMEFSIGYEGKYRKDYMDHSGMANLTIKF